MMKKLEFKKMVFCILLVVLMIMGTAGMVFGNGFENPGQSDIDYVGKQMSGSFTAILEPLNEGDTLPINETIAGDIPVTVTWIFVGECGKVVLGQAYIDHLSDFARFDQFSEELVGKAISADFLDGDPHPCFPYDLLQEQSLIITSAKKIKKVINYDYMIDPNTGTAATVKQRYPGIADRQFPPFGYIAAAITVKLAVVTSAE